jgi:molybdenum cofactor biosynthesis enzyme
MAAKQTSALIPMCHPHPWRTLLWICACARMASPLPQSYDLASTGVEMEALVAASIAADRLRYVQSSRQGHRIREIVLERKSGA